jgi:hypothetical protein
MPMSRLCRDHVAWGYGNVLAHFVLRVSSNRRTRLKRGGGQLRPGHRRLCPKSIAALSCSSGPQPPRSEEVGITCNASGPIGHASSYDHRPNQGPSPSYRPNRGGHPHNAVVPTGRANSVAPIARPSHYRHLRWQLQTAGGLVPLG